MVMHHRFILDHAWAARRGTFVQGSRVLIGAEKSRQMLQDKDVRVHFFSRGIRRRRHTIRTRFLCRLLASPSLDTRFIKSCNQGYWREDLIRVNGFNEAIHGWGREDTELGHRILNAGIARRMIKVQAQAYHLYHPRPDRSRLEINDRILAETIAGKLTRCELGVDQHLADRGRSMPEPAERALP